jgi:hypothetical protein
MLRVPLSARCQDSRQLPISVRPGEVSVIATPRSLLRGFHDSSSCTARLLNDRIHSLPAFKRKNVCGLEIATHIWKSRCASRNRVAHLEIESHISKSSRTSRNHDAHLEIAMHIWKSRRTSRNRDAHLEIATHISKSRCTSGAES